MRHRGFVTLTVLVVLGTAAFGLYRYMWPEFSWNQKISVTVEAGGRAHANSSITQVTVRYQPQLLPQVGVATRTIHGEAVALQLPSGRYLFALLSGSDNAASHAQFVAANVFSDLPHDPHAGPRESISAALADLDEVSRVLPVDLYPMFVTFDELSDPLTVRQIDPLNLEAEFGAGVRLLSVTLATTDEPASDGTIKSILPWLGDFPEPSLDPTGDYRDATLADKLQHGDFLRD
ncbi:MAG: hypothetical protein KDJ43_12580 [Rhizobiaceae bacterium]|nr:hypothetical protein [Rhizobiaceae bacterium]